MSKSTETVSPSGAVDYLAAIEQRKKERELRKQQEKAAEDSEQQVPDSLEAIPSELAETSIPPSTSSMAENSSVAVGERGAITSRLVKPAKKETKSVLKNFKFKPSLITSAQKKAKKMGISMNDLMNQLLQMWVDEKD